MSAGEIAFPHAIKHLAEAVYTSILARAGASGPPPDYLRINGQPYVVGVGAERHGVQVQRTGAVRYTRDTYRAFAAAALARLYERSQEISIFGSYPPGDMKFREDLMKSVIGDWQVE